MRTLIYLVLCILFFSFPTVAQETKSVGNPVCEQNSGLLNFDLDVSFSKWKDDKREVIIRSQIENGFISFIQDGEDLFRSKLRAYGKIMNVSGTKRGTFGQELSHSFDKTDYQRIKAEKTEFEKKVLLSPGIYKVDLFIFDENSKWCGKKTKVFDLSKNEAGN